MTGKSCRTPSQSRPHQDSELECVIHNPATVVSHRSCPHKEILQHPQSKPPVEAALVVSYLQFPIQVCFPCSARRRPRPLPSRHRHIPELTCGFNSSTDMKCMDQEQKRGPISRLRNYASLLFSERQCDMCWNKRIIQAKQSAVKIRQ